jgi:branched-chain amino acid transport system ATP-binding protein
MLEIKGLKAGYGAMSVLQGIDMQIHAGEIVALLGSNGVGKTTLNNVISGFIVPTAGSVTFKGQRITGLKPLEIVALGIAHVPEGRKIFPNLSVRDNLKLGAFRRAHARIKHNFDRICALFPRLKERLDQLAGTLSGGEQQMLAIGRGMMSEPELIILDEPSLGLSPIMVEEMFAMIAQINAEGAAVLLVEQNVMQSLSAAKRAYVLEQGRFVMEGEAASLLANPQLQQAYLGL